MIFLLAGFLLPHLFVKARTPMAWGGFMQKKPPPPDDAATHYCVELDPFERDALIRLLRGLESGLSGPQTSTLRERLRDARLMQGPRLPEATLDWAELEATAVRQGCSPVDVIFDRAKGKEE